MSQLIAVARVLERKLEEIDREIAKACTAHEESYLWRVRGNVRKVLRALIAREKK